MFPLKTEHKSEIRADDIARRGYGSELVYSKIFLLLKSEIWEAMKCDL